jgi:hypothetical protein
VALLALIATSRQLLVFPLPLIGANTIPLPLIVPAAGAWWFPRHPF